MGRLAIRVWAVAVLVLGILVMHHMARPSNDAPTAHESSAVQLQAAGHGTNADMAVVAKTRLGGEGTAAGDEVPPIDHDLLHLCLAVITAAVALLVGWLLLTRRVWTMISPVLVFRARPVLARPPPRPRGSVLLVSLCVMRT
jgi:hypothetical protein